MPAIRNRPRVDIVLRVPKARPFPLADEAARVASTSTVSARDPQRNVVSIRGDLKLGEGSGSGIAVGPLASTENSNASSSSATFPNKADVDNSNAAETDSSSNVIGPPDSSPRTRPQETSCAEWNSLLIWARRMRGPQWDSSVGMWMVDQGSEEYYTFSSDPTQSVHSGGPSTSIPALPPHIIQDQDSPGSSTRPHTASGQEHQQQSQQHLLGAQGISVTDSASSLAPSLRPPLNHNANSSAAVSSHSAAVSTSSDTKPEHLLAQQGGLGVQMASMGGRRASPRW